MTELIVIAEMVLVAGWWLKRKRNAVTSSLNAGDHTPMAIRSLTRKLEPYINSATSLDKAMAQQMAKALRSFVQTAACEQLLAASLRQLRRRLWNKGGPQ
jgi:hypothetical protein